MSAPGHCRHCEEGCTGDTPILGWPDDEPHTDDNGATWPGGDCPACDEAECIAAKCIEWAEGCYQRGEDDAVRELNEMADFARGDR